jgi:sporulation protein YlmC with PRC-barrel domain
MKRSLKELRGYTLQAIDGEKGKVNNFLFDDETWKIRYLEADLGGFFSDKRVLIPRNVLGKPLWTEKHFPVELTVEKIENSPDLEFDLPVSRKYERILSEHYELHPYWPASMVPYAGVHSMFNPDTPLTPPRKRIEEETIDTSLRSFNEIRGYIIHADDERFGHIEDIVIDDENWQILYVIIDTKNFVPWSKIVMLPIELIDEISYKEHEARINLSKEIITGAPEYVHEVAFESQFEKDLIDYYREIVL